MRQEKIRNHYENLLKEKIKASGRKCDTFEDILDNLDVLAKEEVKFGDEKTLWLDLQTKKIIAKAIDPNCRIEIPKDEIVREKDSLSVTAYFYWSDCDTFVGRGFAKKNITSLISGDYDAAKVEAEFEALVMGSAITRAYTDAGIGIEFYADGFDELFADVERTEAEEILNRKEEQFTQAVPEVPSAKVRKERKRAEKAKAAAEEAPATEPAITAEPSATADPITVTESVAATESATAPTLAQEELVIAPETLSENTEDSAFSEFVDEEDLPFEAITSNLGEDSSPTASEPQIEASESETDELTLEEFAEPEEPETVAAEASKMTVEEAMKVVADLGTFIGQPLGIVYKARPLALLWLVNNQAGCKDAALTIINSDPALKNRFEATA